MASFGAVTFIVDGDSFQERRAGRVTVQEIPGGDLFYVDRAGRGPLFWSFRLLLNTFGEWSTLTTLLATSAALTVEGQDAHTATLMNLTAPTTQVDGKQLATAEFVITTA